MAGIVHFTPQEYQEAAHKWRKELLMLPIIGCEETLQHMTKRRVEPKLPHTGNVLRFRMYGFRA